MTGRFNEARLAMLRDLVAALRAFDKEDYDRTNEILERHQKDVQLELKLSDELVEVVSSIFSAAIDFGLPAKALLQEFVSRVPADLRPFYERAADLVIAVHEQTQKAHEDTEFQNPAELGAFFKALLNIGVWLNRQTAQKLGVKPDGLFDATAKQLAGE